MTIDEIMTKMAGKFKKEKALGISAKVLFIFSGAQACEWSVIIKDQQCTVEKSKVEAPQLTVKADSEDWIKIFEGKMDASKAFMMGKVRVNGNMALGSRLLNVFDLNK